MHVLVLHRVPDSFARYAENIDHARHDVTYVHTADRAVTLPAAAVGGLRLERPGQGDTADEVLDAIAGLPTPDVVVALSEYDLLAAGRLRDRLGLPGPSEAEVLPVRDKVVMKRAVAAAGLRVPRFLPLAEALRRGPGGLGWQGATVLKPLAGASSEGVESFPDPATALAAGTDVAVGEYEVEEFVEGPIVHVDGLVVAGELVAVVASEYVGTCLGFATGRPLGSVQTELDPALEDWSRRCLDALAVRDGPFHLEGIVTPDGPVFLELGARFGGADVVDTFELATGVRLPPAHVQLLVDGPIDPPRPRPTDPSARYGWFVLPGHTLGSTHCRVRGHERFRDDPLMLRWVERDPDEPISTTVTYADHLVPAAGLVGPGSTAQLRAFLGALFEEVRVEPVGVTV
ncbi:hypothetical protein [Actinomycetospora sp. NBRC 106378]|uniref:ATP-grasp domain-containing protein n=1 Tax=Actinomycetospora sp. NBRC 106378 TaxID=3032208 RepID=UPI0024A01A1A|nr:hypothetical protein [Actinomycetospora sp. NBRC 106378]GLZ51898.1 hypothetical protein Acsp07_15150 [Actinomycetospora sp. NBRC 106378]